MAVDYLGQTNWEQVEQIEWSSESWTHERARVVFKGRATARTRFENTLRRWQTMPGFPLMRLDNWQSINSSPCFPSVELFYIGLKSKNLPPVKAVNGTSIQSAQGQGTDTVSGQTVSGTFVYRASRTTYTWFTDREPPATSPYFLTERPLNPLQNILVYHMEDATTGRRVNTIPYSSFVAVFNSLIIANVVSNYEREPVVPGILWACRADVDYMIT